MLHTHAQQCCFFVHMPGGSRPIGNVSTGSQAQSVPRPLSHLFSRLSGGLPVLCGLPLTRAVPGMEQASDGSTNHPPVHAAPVAPTPKRQPPSRMRAKYDVLLVH